MRGDDRIGMIYISKDNIPGTDPFSALLDPRVNLQLFGICQRPVDKRLFLRIRLSDLISLKQQRFQFSDIHISRPVSHAIIAQFPSRVYGLTPASFH